MSIFLKIFGVIYASLLLIGVVSCPPGSCYGSNLVAYMPVFIMTMIAIPVFLIKMVISAIKSSVAEKPLSNDRDDL
jgi:hypothetical protein